MNKLIALALFGCAMASNSFQQAEPQILITSLDCDSQKGHEQAKEIKEFDNKDFQGFHGKDFKQFDNKDFQGHQGLDVAWKAKDHGDQKDKENHGQDWHAAKKWKHGKWHGHHKKDDAHVDLLKHTSAHKHAYKHDYEGAVCKDGICCKDGVCWEDERGHHHGKKHG